MFDDDFILTPQEAFDLSNQNKIVLVDIREVHEWQKTGVAPSAHLIAMSDPDFVGKLENLKNGFPDAKVAIICAAGGRSSRVQQALHEMGWSEVYNVLEGMSGGQFGHGWVASQLPTKPCPIPASA